ncbi:cation diffusion facilitator family transporter [Pseudonocardia sp. RS010]|uniref:cation diffusion facilitator family transporter n=1 Tax=Pseudonocardia sp. RS010 TaxID=3385979 RepID=UPI0039A30D40
MGAQGHGHGVRAEADRRWLGLALGLIVAFMVVEFVVGLLAGSLALITDSAHMLTDAASIALALVALRLAARPARGGYTYGLPRAEILSAQANGITLLLLAVWFVYEGIQRLLTPPQVAGLAVLVTALVGIVVNLAASWCISRADRSSLNVEGAFQHILNDLFAFIATAVAGLVVLLTGFDRADAIAALLVAGLMVRAGWGLVRESGRIFLEAAPRDVDPEALGGRLAEVPGVAEVHDLHVWEITSGRPALSAHVLARPEADCHEVRRVIERVLHDEHGLDHTTLQVDHRDGDAPAGSGDSGPWPGGEDPARSEDGRAPHCADPHGPVHLPRSRPGGEPPGA